MTMCDRPGCIAPAPCPIHDRAHTGGTQCPACFGTGFKVRGTVCDRCAGVGLQDEKKRACPQARDAVDTRGLIQAAERDS